VNNQVVKIDLAIIGAGLNGLVCALAAAQKGYSIAIIEQKSFVPPYADARQLALSQHSINFLKTLGLGEALNEAFAPFNKVLFSAQKHAACLNFQSKPGKKLGGAMPAQHLLEALRQAVLKHTNIKVLAEATLVKAVYHPQFVSLSLKRADKSFTLQSGLLVGADGADSWVRKFAQLSWQQKPCSMQALLLQINHYQQQNSTALLRAFDSLFVAYVPQKDRFHGMVVLTGAQAQIEALSTEPSHALRSYVQRALAHRMGILAQCHIIGAPWPLSLGYAPQLAAKRSVLVGSASLAAPPIAALGFNLGLRDIASLIDCLPERGAFQTAQAEECLQRYQSNCMQAHHRVWQFCNLMPKMWQNHDALLRWARAIGLLGASMMPSRIVSGLHA
jgi:2-octaprenyl-6-methoxyphenol hydroxylase